MTLVNFREIRRFKYKDEPYYVYYAPGMSLRSHDHKYILRLISDWLANHNPEEFALLPQFRAAAL